MNRDIMEQAGFGEEMKKVEAGLCPLCGKKININDFKDDSSITEFTISGMCQNCQDKFLSDESENG